MYKLFLKISKNPTQRLITLAVAIPHELLGRVLAVFCNPNLLTDHISAVHSKIIGSSFHISVLLRLYTEHYKVRAKPQ